MNTVRSGGVGSSYGRELKENIAWGFVGHGEGSWCFGFQRRRNSAVVGQRDAWWRDGVAVVSAVVERERRFWYGGAAPNAMAGPGLRRWCDSGALMTQRLARWSHRQRWGAVTEV